MANVLDENVVILRFDNSNFKKNTEESIDSLNKLKASINDSTGSSGKQIDALGKAANTINLSSLSKSIDTVNKRFSLLGVAGMAAINKLTSSAMGSAAKLVKAIPKQMISGGWSRALNIEQAKFLIEGLGFVWDKTSAKYKKGMKTVYEAVDNAVTGTRYALDEAAVVASQLMSSGVQDVNKLEESLQSISGLASVVGANYSDIGRIFAQVAGQGRMMGDDLLQLQQRGIGAADEIAKHLNLNKDVAQAALDSAIAQGRQVKKMEEIRSHAEITGADVREMVSAGAINFDILSDSFKGLFKQAKKANDTYSGSLANLKSALNRIGQTVENFKLANMTKIFNALLPVVKKLKDYIDPLSEAIGNASSKITDFLIKGIINPLGKTIGVAPKDLFKGFGDAVKEAGEESETAGEKTKKLGDKIRVTTKEWQAALDIWNKGTYGTGQKRADAIRELGMSYENVQGIINKFYKNKFNWEKTRSEYDVSDETKKNNELNKSVAKSTTALSKEEKQMTVLGKVMKGVINFTKAAANTFKAFKNIIIAVWNAGKKARSVFGGLLSEVFLKISKVVLDISKKFLDLSEILNNKGLDGLKEKAPKIANALEIVKKAIDAVIGQAKKFASGLKSLFSTIQSSKVLDKFVSSFKQLGKTIKSGVVESFKAISDRFKEFKNTIGTGGLFENLSKAIISIVSGLSNFITALTGGEKVANSFMAILGSFANKIIAFFSPVFEWLVDKFFAAGETLVEFFKKLGESEGINKLKNALGDLFQALQKVQNPIGDVTNGLSNLVHSTSVGGLNSVVNFFSNMASGLADFIQGVASGKHPIESFLDLFGKVRDGLSLKGAESYIKGTTLDLIKGNILSTRNGLVGSMAIAAQTLNKAKIGDSFAQASDGIFTFCTKLSGGASRFNFNGLAKDIIDAFKAADWDKISTIALRFGTLAAMLKAVNDLGGVAKGAANVLNSIAGVPKTMKDIGNTISTQIKMESFRTMATAIAILVASVVALSMIPTDRLIPAMGGVTALLLILTGIIALANSPKFDSKKMIGVGVAFAGMGAGIMLIALSMKMLAKMKPTELAKGAIVIGAFMLIFAQAVARADAVGKTGVAFMAMAVAVHMLVMAVMAFAAMKITTLLKGGLAILGFVTMISLASRVANSSQPKGFITMAIALGLLIPSILILALMPLDKLAKGGGAVMALMLGLAFSARIANSGGFESLGKMAGVIAVLAAATLVFSFINPDRLATATTALVSMMLSLSLAAKFAKEGAKGLLAMTLMIATIAAAITLLIELNPDEAIKVAIGLSALALSLGIALGLFSKIGLKGAAIGAAGFDVALGIIIAGIIGILAGLAKLNEEIGAKEGDFNNFLKKGLPLIETMGTAVGSFFGKMKAAFTEAAGDAPTLVEQYKDLFNSIGDMIGSLGEVDTADLGKLTEFATALGSIGRANLTSGFGAFLGGGQIDIADQLGSFADSFNQFTTKIKDVPEDTVSKAQMISKVFSEFAKGAAWMPAQGGMIMWGSYKNIGEFASGFSDVAKEVAKMAKVIDKKEIDASVIDAVKPVAEVLKTFASIELPASGGLLQLGTGNTTLKDFGKFLSSFGENFATFKEAIAGLEGMDEFIAEGSNLEKVCQVISTMVTAGSEIPPSGGLKQFVDGNTTLQDFASQLVGFATSFSTFAQTVADIPEEDFATATGKIDPIIKAISAMAQVKMPDTGGLKQGIFGGQNLGSFAVQLARFAPSFTKFANGLKDTPVDDALVSKTSNIQKVIDAAAKIKLPDKSFWERIKDNGNITSFGTKISGLVTSLNKISGNAGKINTSGITKLNSSIAKIKSAVTSFKDIGTIPTGGNLATLANNINKFSKKVGSSDTSGLAAKASEVASSVKSFAKTASTSISSSGTSSFSKQGKDMGNAMAKGLSSSSSGVTNAAKSLQKKAKSAIDTNALYSTGKNLSEGLARGMRSALGQIRSAADEMERQAERAVRAKAKVKSPSKVFMQIGAFIGEGFVLGINSYASRVYAAGNNMAQRSVDAANDAMASLDLFSNPTITPVIDLSEVRKGASQIDAMVTSQRAISVDQNVNAMQSRYSTPNIVNELLSRMNDTLTVRVDSEDGLNGANIVNNITVDGTENPEAFARSFVRSLQQELRTV